MDILKILTSICNVIYVICQLNIDILTDCFYYIAGLSYTLGPIIVKFMQMKRS